jgi:hypothetical protein
VVTRRAKRREPGALAARQQRVDQRARPAGGAERRLERPLAQRRVEVERALARAQLAYGLDVRPRVDGEELLL